MNISRYTDPNRLSPAWDTGNPELVCYQTDDGTQYAMPWHAIGVAQLVKDEIFLHYGPGTIVIGGPKVTELWSAFVTRQVTAVRADGIDITHVTMHLRQADNQ